MPRPPARVLLAALLLPALLLGCSAEEEAEEFSPSAGDPGDVASVDGEGSAFFAPESDSATASASPAGSEPAPVVPEISDAEAEAAVDPALPAYTRGEAVNGTISVEGSDTMSVLVTLWGEAMADLYPALALEVKSKGSGSAIPALEQGAALFGVMSREPNGEEIRKFKDRYGYEPTVLATSTDLLALFVHKDNPIGSLTLPEVDAIYSKDRNLGADAAITNWNQLGVTGPLGAQAIQRFGRNPGSGTYDFMNEVALGGGAFADGITKQAGTSGVVTAVGNVPAGIGYGGVGALTANVRPVKLAEAEGADAFEPTIENFKAGTYPLARPLYLVINREPGRELSPLVREFVRYVFSRDGQKKVVQAGYFPVTAEEAAAELEAVGLGG